MIFLKLIILVLSTAQLSSSELATTGTILSERAHLGDNDQHFDHIPSAARTHHIVHEHIPWWEDWGRPYLQPDAGIFMTPKQNVYIPAATWTHIIELKLPCLSDVLTKETTVSWTQVVDKLSIMIGDIIKHEKFLKNRFLYEETIYQAEIQRNLENLLVNIKNRIHRLDTTEQYVYDLMDKICVPVDTSMLRDDYKDISPREKFRKEMLDAINENENEMPEDDIRHRERKTKEFEDMVNNPEFMNKFQNMYTALHKQGIPVVMKPSSTTTSTQPPVPTSPSTVSTTSTQKPIGRLGMMDTDEEIHPMRKRDVPYQEIRYPESYANNVNNQFINHGSFTNVLGEDPTRDLGAQKNIPQDMSYKPRHRPTFSSKVYQPSGETITVREVPVSTQYSMNPVRNQTVFLTPPSPHLLMGPFIPQAPKEGFLKNVRKMLETASPDMRTKTKNEIFMSIDEYYKPQIDVILNMSSNNPVYVPSGSLGVMTLKICYNFITSDNKISTTCTDRFLPSIKHWQSTCHIDPVSEDIMMSDAPYDPEAYAAASYQNQLDSQNFKFRPFGLFRPRINSPFLNTHHRSKRGGGDIIMEYVWKPLFGSASEYDLKKILDFLNDTRASQADLYTNQNLMMSKINQNSNSISKLATAMSNITSSIAETLKNTQSDLDKLSEELNQQSSISQVHQMLSAILAMQTYVGSSLNLLKFKLDDISKTYDTLYLMVKGKYLSPSVLASDTLGDLLEGLETFRSDIYQIAPTWKKLSNIDDRSVGMMVKGRAMIITLKIPLIRLTDTYTTYISQSVPVLVGKQVIEAVGAQSYYVIDKTNREWIQMTPSEYMSCFNNPGHICSHSYPAHLFTVTDCYMSLVVGKDLKAPNQKCKMRYLGNDSSIDMIGEEFVAKPVSSNQWIVSILAVDGLPAYERCDEKINKHAVTTTSLRLTGVNALVIDEGCRVQIGDTIFSTTKNWRTNAYQSISFNDSILINTHGLQNVTVWQMTSLIPDVLSNATIFSFNRDNGKKKSRYVFKDNIASLQDILDSIQQSVNRSYDIGLIDPKIPDVPEFDIKEPSYWSFSHWQVWSFILGSLPVLLGLGFLGLCILKWMFKSRAAAATVAFSALPTSLAKAESILADKVDLQELIAGMRAMNTSLMLKNAHDEALLEENQILGRHTEYVQSWGMVLMTIGMGLMVIMGIAHYVTLMKHNSLLRKLVRVSGAVPRNKAVTMHNVEEPLILVFLVRVERYMSRLVSNTTLAIQVATLPLPASQWFVKSRDYTHLICSTTEIKRWTKNLIITFNWSHMCIQSDKYENLDTCEDMPTTCVIPRHSIEMGIDGGLPWDWSSIHQGRVLRMDIGRGSSLRTLYHYVGDDDGSMVDIPLMSRQV